MNISAEQILYRKAALIFEELGFLMPRSETREHTHSECMGAVVSFSGSSSGCLLLSLSSQVLPVLTANMLGDDGCSDPSLEEDSLREIAHIICGNALPAILGTDSVFYLDTPALLDDPESLLNASEYDRIAHVNIAFDSGYAAVTLLVKRDLSATRANNSSSKDLSFPRR